MSQTSWSLAVSNSSPARLLTYHSTIFMTYTCVLLLINKWVFENTCLPHSVSNSDGYPGEQSIPLISDRFSSNWIGIPWWAYPAKVGSAPACSPPQKSSPPFAPPWGTLEMGDDNYIFGFALWAEVVESYQLIVNLKTKYFILWFVVVEVVFWWPCLQRQCHKYYFNLDCNAI